MQFLNGFQVKSPPLLQWLNELLTTLCLTRIWGKAFYTDDGDEKPLRALVVFFSSLWKTDEANSKSKGVYLTCLEQSSCKRGSYFTLFGFDILTNSGWKAISRTGKLDFCESSSLNYALNRALWTCKGIFSLSLFKAVPRPQAPPPLNPRIKEDYSLPSSGKMLEHCGPFGSEWILYI